MKSDGKEREAERQRARINRRRASEEYSSRKFMRHLRLCLLITEADRVLCHLVIFLRVFLHWIYKMRYSCYQHSFCYSWLACLLGCGREMHRSTKRNRKSSFSKISYSYSLFLDYVKNLKRFLPYLMHGFPSCISTGKLE